MIGGSSGSLLHRLSTTHRDVDEVHQVIVGFAPVQLVIQRRRQRFKRIEPIQQYWEVIDGGVLRICKAFFIQIIDQILPLGFWEVLVVNCIEPVRLGIPIRPDHRQRISCNWILEDLLLLRGGGLRPGCVDLSLFAKGLVSCKGGSRGLRWSFSSLDGLGQGWLERTASLTRLF